MQTQNHNNYHDRHIILLLYSLLEHQCVVYNSKIYPTPSLPILALDMPFILATIPMDQQVIIFKQHFCILMPFKQ